MAKKRRKAAKKKNVGKKKETVKRKKKISRSGWSATEIAQLKKLFANNSTSSIAGQLKRTVKSVGQKASRLRLKKSKRYMKTLGRV
ncbi:MAG TPA: hypothetical protein VMW23_09195 [Sedimentisphaerales bacterium]|nr:hypothetical protein [Sedimentisphaerales bacterium]